MLSIGWVSSSLSLHLDIQLILWKNCEPPSQTYQFGACRYSGDPSTDRPCPQVGTFPGFRLSDDCD